MTAFLPDIPAELRDPARAYFHIIPVPYDATSTWRKGADKGPKAIIDASEAVEWYDIQTRAEPHQLGVATHDPIHWAGPPDELAQLVQARVASVLDDDHLPIVLGGEHSVSIGAIRAAAKRHPELTTLQIDAHADTRESYMGSPCNHACVMARAREVSRIVQVGIRSMDAEETLRLRESRVFFAHDIAEDSADAWIERVCALLTPSTYVTIDLDALDPGIMPATGTPEPGGLSWRQVNKLLEAVARRTRIVGCDVVELCPREDLYACDFLAAKLVHRLMAIIASQRGPQE